MRGARGIFNAATDFIKTFKEGYEGNMCWLSEVHEEALRIVNSPTVWLPRTPGTKKTKRTFAHVGAWNQESTFHEGSEKKKLKIDDFSTINDNSMVEANTSVSNASRALRPRPQRQGKNAMQKKQPKRIAKKMDSGQDKVESIVTSQAFIPPATIASIFLDASSNDSTLKLANSNRKIQSKVQGGQKLFKKVDFGDTIIKNSDALFTDACLEGKNEEVQETNRESGEVLSRNTLLNDSNVGDQSVVEHILPVPTTVNDTIETEPDVNTIPVSSSTPDVKERKEIEVIQSSPLYNADSPTKPGSPQSPAKCGILPDEDVQTPVQGFINSSPQNNDGIDNIPQEHLSGGMSREEDGVQSPGEVSYSLPQDNDSDVSPDNADNQAISNKGKDDVDASDVGRRGTYKIMVNNIIDDPLKKLSLEIDKNALPSIMSNACDTGSGNRMGKDVKKVPQVVKPIKPSNVVSNVKSFVKRTVPLKEIPIRSGNIVTNIKTFRPRPESPKQTEADCDARKGLPRPKRLEEIQSKRPMQLEERKRQQEEREKRIAEQQRKIQEEEDHKRKQLEIKAAQIQKNQEAMRKIRDQEQKKKKIIRENKQADIVARRQKEDDERNRKALELIEEERIKNEILQRKVELEDQKRQELKVQKDILEKEKLRKLEQYKIYDEERLKKEFEEKERHRFEVERKKKEDKEKERFDRQLRDERNKQAEKDIADAKKLEEERVKREDERVKREEERVKREEERIQLEEKRIKIEEARKEARKKREEERMKVMEEAKAKAKELAKERDIILNKPDGALRSSPRLAQYNCPKVPLVQRDSSAYVNYGLDEFNSGDSTDDDGSPAKRVPSWALGSRLSKQLMRQFYTDIEPDRIFVNAMQPLRLEIIFNKSKTRYFKRTSSAHWGSPPIKSIFKPRT